MFLLGFMWTVIEIDRQIVHCKNFLRFKTILAGPIEMRN